jgi:peptide chain release factor 3
MAHDKEDTPVFFAESEWGLKTVKEMYPNLVFHSTSDFKDVQES